MVAVCGETRRGETSALVTLTKTPYGGASPLRGSKGFDDLVLEIHQRRLGSLVNHKN